MPGEAPGACEERLHIISTHLRRLPRDRVRTRLTDMCTGTTEQRGEAVATRRREIENKKKITRMSQWRDTHDTTREVTNKCKNRR